MIGTGKPRMYFTSGRTWKKVGSGPVQMPVMQLVGGGAPLMPPTGRRFEPGRTRARHGAVKHQPGALAQ